MLKFKKWIVSYIIIIIAFISILSCGKGSSPTPQPDPPPPPPTVILPTISTGVAGNITQTSVVISGSNVTSDGNATVSARGLVYSLAPNPTESDIKIPCGSGIGAFECTITGLTANTKYYVRGYATNSKGTAYGSEISFTTLPVPPKYSVGQVMSDGFTIWITYNNGNNAKGVKNVGGVYGYGWGCIGTTTGATATGMGTGISNTNIIASICNISAAKLCLDAGGYLPSVDELKELWDNRNNIPNSSTIFTAREDQYWTSTEVDPDHAKVIGWPSGTVYNNWKQSGPGSPPPLTRAGVVAFKNFN